MRNIIILLILHCSISGLFAQQMSSQDERNLDSLLIITKIGETINHFITSEIYECRKLYQINDFDLYKHIEDKVKERSFKIVMKDIKSIYKKEIGSIDISNLQATYRSPLGQKMIQKDDRLIKRHFDRRGRMTVKHMLEAKLDSAMVSNYLLDQPAQSELDRMAKYMAKNKNATELLWFKKAGFGLWFDPQLWSQNTKTNSQQYEHHLNFRDSNISVKMSSSGDRGFLNINKIINEYNKNNYTGYKYLAQDAGLINGLSFWYTKHRDEFEVIYESYYFVSNPAGVLRIVFIGPEQDLVDSESDFQALLNGIGARLDHQKVLKFIKKKTLGVDARAKINLLSNRLKIIDGEINARIQFEVINDSDEAFYLPLPKHHLFQPFYIEFSNDNCKYFSRENMDQLTDFVFIPPYSNKEMEIKSTLQSDHQCFFVEGGEIHAKLIYNPQPFIFQPEFIKDAFKASEHEDFLKFVYPKLLRNPMVSEIMKSK